MRIVITGTPGTGKSTIAALLAAKAGLNLVSIAAIVRKKMRLGPKHEVDLGKLARHLRFLQSEDDYVVEGHLACELRLPADHVIVLRTEPGVLRKRMAQRGYGRRKIEENVMAEMLDYCTQRAKKEYGGAPLEVDTTRRGPVACTNKILAAIKHKRRRIDNVDHQRSLISFLRLHHGRT
jgi:adenylate kinase